MIEESGVKIIKGRLDLKNGVVMDGKRITWIRLEDGTAIKGKMFVDASYEGDLLPLTGVSFVTGRESNSEFNEVGNGNTGGISTDFIGMNYDDDWNWATLNHEERERLFGEFSAGILSSEGSRKASGWGHVPVIEHPV